MADFIVLDCGDKIKGECMLDGYKDKILLLSFSHGVAQQITADPSNTKRTSGRPNHQDLTVTKLLDLASASLINACNTATPITVLNLIIGQDQAGKTNEIMKYEMKNALVSSHSIGGGGGGVPQETVTFNYSAITWTYKPQQEEVTATGQTVAKWDLAENKAV